MEINPKKKPKENSKAMSLSWKWAWLPSQALDRKPRPPILKWREMGSVRGMMNMSAFSLTS